MDISASILSRIGNTPLVRLNRVARDVPAEICVKVEYVNPSGSLKDRIALRMIEDAEKSGKLRPGMTIVDASTGNTAAALAFVGAVKGYHVQLLIPTVAASEERMRIMKAYGAEVTFVELPDPNDTKSKGALHGSVVERTPRQRCLDMERAAPDKIWWARQFINQSNVAAHADGTGREILAQTDGQVDAFIAAIGTCGTIIGVSKTLRAHNPAVKIVAVEPKDSPVIKDGKLTISVDENVSGGLLAEMVHTKVAQQIIQVSEADAIGMAHRLSEEEGLFCGLSSGANVVAAIEIARDLKKGQRVVTILPDNRDRYLFKERFTT